MADHLDAPGFKSPNMDARVDICDIYALNKPEDSSKSVFVLDVNPIAPTFANSFASEAVYELKVDTNGDAVANIAYRFTFSPKEDGVQKVTVLRASGQQAKDNGSDGEVIFKDVRVSFGDEINIADSGEYRLFAGIRSDPFFFDVQGMKNNMQFTGADTFLDKNVFSIVMEIPNSAFGSSSKVGIWYRVLIPKYDNPFFQIDRMGRPFISTAFTKEEDKNTFNRIEPIRDRELFTKKFVEVLETFGHDHGSAQKTALSLLPDILDYGYSTPEGYPNGRKLTDDVMDFQLSAYPKIS
jgi:hypothetical protein